MTKPHKLPTKEFTANHIAENVLNNHNYFSEYMPVLPLDAFKSDSVNRFLSSIIDDNLSVQIVGMELEKIVCLTLMKETGRFAKTIEIYQKFEYSEKEKKIKAISLDEKTFLEEFNKTYNLNKSNWETALSKIETYTEKCLAVEKLYEKKISHIEFDALILDARDKECLKAKALLLGAGAIIEFEKISNYKDEILIRRALANLPQDPCRGIPVKYVESTN